MEAALIRLATINARKDGSVSMNYKDIYDLSPQEIWLKLCAETNPGSTTYSFLTLLLNIKGAEIQADYTKKIGRYTFWLVVATGILALGAIVQIANLFFQNSMG